MKKIFNNLNVAILLLTIFSSCQDEVYEVDSDMYNKNKETMNITVNDKYKEVDDSEHFITASFESNFWWNANVVLVNENGDYETADWFKMTPTRNFGNRDVSFEITRNIEKNHDRKVEITFTSDDGNFSHTLSLFQTACTPFIEISSATKSFSILGGKYQMYVTTSEEWKITGLPSWIKVNIPNQSINMKGKDILVELEVEEYSGSESDEDRECEIIFETAESGSTAKPQKLIVTQTCSAKGPETVTLASTDEDIIVEWDAPAGAIYYDIIAYDTNGAELDVVRYTPQEEKESYSSSISSMAWDDYVGKIDVVIRAYLSDDVHRESNKGLAMGHNYFSDDSGDGSSSAEGSVLKIYNIRHLENIQKSMNAGKFLYFKQMADIDLSYYENNTYSPIGTIDKPFVGSYDGNNFKFSGLKYSSQKDYSSGFYYGLFGVVDSETGLYTTIIENVIIEESSISAIDTNAATLDAANNYTAVGNIAGMVKGGAQIENCVVNNCNITGGGVNSRSFFGGFVGVCDNAYIKDCVITGESFKFANKATSCGGIVGMSVNDLTIVENCINRVRYFNYDSNSVTFGGIVARGVGSIRKCANYTTMRLGQYTGGILAHAQYYKGSSSFSSGILTIEDCVNYGDVKEVAGSVGTPNISNANGAFGGIAANISTNTGQNPNSKAIVERCANFGNLIGQDFSRTDDKGFYVGGIVGYGQLVRLTDCVNHGSFSGTAGGTGSNNRIFQVGGISGYMSTVNSSISNSYSTGSINYSITGTTTTYNCGGLCGTFNPTSNITDAIFSYSFVLNNTTTKIVGNDRNISGTTSGFKTEDALKSASTFTTWNTSVWNISEGAYPNLKNIHAKE